MTGKSVAQEYAEVREQEHKRSEERRQKRSGNGADAERGVSLDDFWAYMVQHAYIFAPTGDLWPGSSVNARIPPIQVGIDDDGKPVMVSAAAWLDRNKPVEQMTWAPGDPAIITGRLISHGGWIPRQKHTVFNQYRPPLITPGNALEAQRWLDTSTRSIPTTPTTSSNGSRSACSSRTSRSITDWSSAARKASVRTRCSSRRSAPSGRGISPRCRRR